MLARVISVYNSMKRHKAFRKGKTFYVKWFAKAKNVTCCRAQIKGDVQD